MADRSNIVLLSVDALRADHLSCHGHDRETTPVIDRLSEENLWFTNAYSGSTHTREAVPSLLTGRYPDIFAENGYQLIGKSIASTLQERQYMTGGFHSNPYASRAYGFDEGFTVFDDDLYLGDSKLLALGQRLLDKFRNRHYSRAETINERALEWIDTLTHEEPFFLWNHYMDVHGPYQPPSRYRDEFVSSSVTDKKAKQLYRRSVDKPGSITAEERELQQSLYDAEIRYVDEQIGSFLQALEDRKLLSDSLIILTSDHGDAFGDQGYFGHPRELDDALLHVPLVVMGDGIPERQVESPVSTIDVAPTIFETIGESGRDLQGTPLQEIGSRPKEYSGRHVLSQATSIDGMERQFRATGLNGSCRMEVTLNSESITTQSCDSSEAESVVLKFIRERLDTQNSKVADEESDVNEEAIEERLQALGYK